MARCEHYKVKLNRRALDGDSGMIMRQWIHRHNYITEVVEEFVI
jgi:hypothetical protein